jgi:hypothetical protein
MRGTVVHRWELPFRAAWPNPSHVRDPLPDHELHWFKCRAYPNGDLLAIYHSLGDTPYGYGLVKVDKDSRPVWAYPAAAHHDMDVDDDGTIYTLTQKIERHPPKGLERLPSPLIADAVAVLAPDGRELDTVPILEAFRDSPYAGMLLDSIDLPPKYKGSGDLIHANSIKVLRRAVAPKFPLFKPGQVLISLRHVHTLAVLDLPTRKVVWAARGVWQLQHDAAFLDTGDIVMYDNCGSAYVSRVVDYNPISQAVTRTYACENILPFRTACRGAAQRVPNGNTLLSDPDHWMLLEVTPEKELVWEACCGGVVTGARRYPADELTFLKGAARARP